MYNLMKISNLKTNCKTSKNMDILIFLVYAVDRNQNNYSAVFHQYYRGLKTFEFIYHATTLPFWKIPKTTSTPLPLPSRKVLEYSFTEFFLIKKGRWVSVQKLFLRWLISTLQKPARWFGKPCMPIIRMTANERTYNKGILLDGITM